MPSKKRESDQVDKFKDLARKLGTHESEERFKEAVEQALRERPRPAGKPSKPKSKPPAK